MRIHPAAELFPLIEGEEFDRFVEDVRQRGQIEPITIMPDGAILDGRNRYRACEAIGIVPATRSFEGDDPVAYVISTNLHRRHLNESQRAMVASKLANLGEGRPEKTAQIYAVSQSDAAEKLSVSRRSVQAATKVRDAGTKELVDAVEQGYVPVSQAAKIAEAEPEKQREYVERVIEGSKPAEAARQIRREKLKERTLALPDGVYRVIYADPPWAYGDERTALQGYTAAETHYPTMSVADLCALPVKAMAADDAVLFLWATFPLLPDALEVVRAWSFAYKTAFVWDKVRRNFGNYHGANAELLVIATRGSGVPEVRHEFDQVQVHEKTARHSEKPEVFRSIIDTLYPSGPRVELFRRGPAPSNWTVWGNEAVA